MQGFDANIATTLTHNDRAVCNQQNKHPHAIAAIDKSGIATNAAAIAAIEIEMQEVGTPGFDNNRGSGDPLRNEDDFAH